MTVDYTPKRPFLGRKSIRKSIPNITLLWWLSCCFLFAADFSVCVHNRLWNKRSINQSISRLDSLDAAAGHFWKLNAHLDHHWTWSSSRKQPRRLSLKMDLDSMPLSPLLSRPSSFLLQKNNPREVGPSPNFGSFFVPVWILAEVFSSPEATPEIEIRRRWSGSMFSRQIWWSWILAIVGSSLEFFPGLDDVWITVAEVFSNPETTPPRDY